MSRLPAASLPFWPEDRLQAALAALAAAGTPAAPTSASDPACDLDPVEVSWASLPRSLPALAPAVLTLGAPFPGHLVRLAASRWRGLTLLAPDGSRRRLRASRLARTLGDLRTLGTAPENLGTGAMDALLAAPALDGLPPTARRRARQALLAAQLAAAPGLRAHLAMAKPARAAGACRQGARHPGPPLAPLLRRAAALAAAILAAQALSWLAWLTLGGAVLAGRIDAATDLTWALLCLSLPAARALELAAANALASRIALRLRRCLFAATLALPAAVLRADGIGCLLGRLLAIESCEASLLAAAPAAGLAVAELAGAGAALGHGAAPALHLVLLAAAVAVAALLAIHRAGAERGLAAGQRALTGQLVEALAGHRTLRAQGGPRAEAPSDRAGRHALRAQGRLRAEPSSDLADHHALLRTLGTRELRLRTLLPRAWLLAGLGALGAASSGAAPSPAALALSLGGLLLAQDALARLAAGFGHLGAAWIAGQEILPILAAARAAAPPATATPTNSASRAISSPTALAATPGAASAATACARRPAAPAATPAGAHLSPAHGATSASTFACARRPTAPGPVHPAVPPPQPPRPPAAPTPIQPHPPASLHLETRRLNRRLPGAPDPLLDAASLAIHPGDRILLTGPSGAGKSTLAALLAAQRPPDSGLLLLDGYDLPTLGAAAWRRRVVAVPQLHANHLFAGSLAWNLLLGRAWPPTPRDLALAAEICRDLGLGDLLDRLPAGLDQPIGEAGWQLSDGEAARVCLARALLQEPDLLILDESLGALDPALRLQVLATLDRRARTLLLIGHPDLDTA